MMYLLLIRIASLLVQSGDRSCWVAEWRGELWAARNAYERNSNPVVRAYRTLCFCAGAFVDAPSFWRNPLPRVVSSPGACLAVVSLVSGITWRLCRDCELRYPEVPHANSYITLTGTLLIACLLLPSFSHWQLHRPAGAPMMIRWHVFLGVKVAAILLVTHQTVMHVVSRGLAVHCVLIGCIASLCWVLRDQHSRCPVCLHRLATPVRVGTYAQSFLGWNGTEVICSRGHGALYVTNEVASSVPRMEWNTL